LGADHPDGHSEEIQICITGAEEVHSYLFGETIKPETPDRASIWTDINIYNELGVAV